MTSNLPPPSSPHPFKILIIGAGIVGLTLAQGCRESNIPFEIFERDRDGERAQGWALTLHWGLRSLERTIGEELAGRIADTAVDPSLNDTEGNFLFLNARTGHPRYKIPPNKLRRRVHRQKFRSLLSTYLSGTIQEGKAFSHITTSKNHVTAHFSDGSEATGSLIVGADGNNSSVRRWLLPGDEGKLTSLPIHLVGVVRRFTEDQVREVRDVDPLLFQGMDPETGNFLWFNFQEIIINSDGSKIYHGLVIISWIIKDEINDAIPATNIERIKEMKRRAAGFAEPLRSIVCDIPETLITTPLRLGDFPCGDGWDNQEGRVTLVGDAAHAMTMYRGEGANHGILDAALLVDQLKRVKAGEITQKEAVDIYEREMKPRAHEAVLKSRQAALDAHDWNALTEGSPTIGGRVPPETAIC